MILPRRSTLVSSDRDDEYSIAQKALQEAIYAFGKADGVKGQIEKLTSEFLLKFREQAAELQNMVSFCNKLQSNFDSLQEAYVILSNPTMTRGKDQRKGRVGERILLQH